jgi:hypothetical protein
VRSLSIRSATQRLVDLNDLIGLLGWLPKNRTRLLLNRLGGLPVRQHTRNRLTLYARDPLL